ncbi:MAG: mandelate racemase/muconate lactonizing enzyme family protein [Blastocatellia bacterium]
MNHFRGATRRGFLRRGIAGMAGMYGLTKFDSAAGAMDQRLRDRFAKLDAVLSLPVLKKELFKSPVIIESIELLRLDGKYVCRVRSRDGAEGLSVAHSTMDRLYPIFLRNVRPFFLGKDARELDLILEKVYIYDFNFRLNGLALGIPLATLEFAILDMLGRIVNLPVARLIGEVHHSEVAVYMATEWREKPVDESLRLIREAVAEHDINALKIKVGGLMFMTTDMYAAGPPGRTEKIVPAVRKIFGDRMTIYADANGFYDVREALRVGRLLEEYRFAYFEEPVMFDHLEEIRDLTQRLTIPIANGEQDYSFYGFRWLLAHGGLDVVQPDNYYFGGMIRSVKVARMAAVFGKTIIPHMSGGGLGFFYNVQLVSALANAGEHHEFKSFRTQVRFECRTAEMKVVRGKIKVPTGPGFGVDLDPDWVAKHELVRG